MEQQTVYEKNNNVFLLKEVKRLSSDKEKNYRLVTDTTNLKKIIEMSIFILNDLYNIREENIKTLNISKKESINTLFY